MSFFIAATILALFAQSPPAPAADVAAVDVAAQEAGAWPQFRGPAASGVSPCTGLPTTFDEPTWRRAMPGLSHASPVVADGRVFVVTAIPQGIEPSLKVGLYGAGDSADDLVETEFRVLALDLATGEVLWDALAIKATPPFGRHTKATQSDSTPAVAEGKVVALFGSHGLFCFDAESGEPRWHAELGPLDCGPWNSTDLHWGFASSPIIADGRVIVQTDVKHEPALAAFELDSGKLAWRVARDDVNGWSTPTVTTAPDGERQVLVNGSKHMGAYALADGAERWRMAGGGGIPVPTPVVANGLAYFTSNHRPLVEAHPQRPVYAVQLAARGDLGVPHPDVEGGLKPPLAWLVARRGNYMQTPLVHGGLVWLGHDSGVVTCLDALTGAEHHRTRLAEGTDGFSASPVLGDGKLYFTSEQGDVTILAPTAEFKVLARAALGDICMATPAIADGALIFRLRGSVARFD